VLSLLDRCGLLDHGVEGMAGILFGGTMATRIVAPPKLEWLTSTISTAHGHLVFLRSMCLPSVDYGRIENVIDNLMFAL
jgi:hypothetical protein